jgi:NAD(P)-dependent dehydrogenase (short-subunit alcohol dehydrogenase family)
MSAKQMLTFVREQGHLMGIPNHTAYAATKAATRSYARTCAAEFKGRDIRVSTLSLGVTDMQIFDARSDSEGRDAWPSSPEFTTTRLSPKRESS